MKRLMLLAVAMLTASVLAEADSTTTIYDGSQSNNVIKASVAGQQRVTLSFRVQSPANENPIYVRTCPPT